MSREAWRLSTDLQDGFSNDEVTVYVDGVEILRKSGVTTDLSSSLAVHHETETGESSVRIEVAVPSRQLRGSIDLDPARTPFLGISVTEGRLEIKPSETMFYSL